MRGAFIQTLVALAERDPRIFLLTGDLGYMALEPFVEQFPERFVNVGVAEQNMVGVATGLAEAGYLPFCYSIVTFATLRPYEFIRNGPVLHNLPVRIIGVGAGVEYAHNGPTHYGLEDIAVMRAQPGIAIIAPGDAEQTRSALSKTYALPQPIYYRLGKDDRLTIPALGGKFEFNKPDHICSGSDVLIISTGAISAECVSAVEKLKASGISARLIAISTLNPVDTETLAGEISAFNKVVTVESHYLAGGLGSLVAEVIAEHELHSKLVRCAIKNTPDGTTGSQSFMHTRMGISADSIAEKAMALVAG